MPINSVKPVITNPTPASMPSASLYARSAASKSNHFSGEAVEMPYSGLSARTGILSNFSRVAFQRARHGAQRF